MYMQILVGCTLTDDDFYFFTLKNCLGTFLKKQGNLKFF